MIKKNKIPTILGVIMLLAGTFLGVFYLNMAQVFRIGASAQTSPKDVRVGNIGDSTATVSWTTDGKTSGFVNWGVSEGNISKVEKEDEVNSKYYVHSITLSGLSPGTTYFYKINSDGVNYDNNGVPWSLTTGATLDINKNSFPISGSVITPSGQPSIRALVYMTVGGYLASTPTSETGNFVFQLANVRTSDLSSYADISPSQTLLQISVQSGPDGVASAQIYPQAANPIPPIILGQIYDLRSLQPTHDNQNPNVNLQLPENSTPGSKFNIPSPSGSPVPKSVILENVTEGEVITSNQPQFFGKGPGGETITITVHSQTPITESVKIPASGSWSWSPPTNLDPGAHSITISWVDTTGITRSLTRDFVVQAGEAPAFTASQSGSTSAPSASPVVTPKLTATPKPTATASAAPVPVTGDLTPTFVLSIMGIAIIAFSFIIWKISES